MRPVHWALVASLVVGVACTPTPGEPEPIATTTTTAVPVVTTTTSMPAAGAPEVLDFIEDFAGWLDADDVDALVEALHPFVVERGGVDLCRSFIESQIIRFEDYVATDAPIGPTPLRFPEGDAEVWTVPVSFVYEGAAYDAEAVVSVESGVGSWFTECR